MILLVLNILIEAIYFLITLPFGLIGMLLGLINKKIQYTIGYWIVAGASWIHYHCNGSKLTITGREHVPKDETVLLVGNHKSQLDIPLLILGAPCRAAFIAKDSLKKVPAVNLWMYFMGGLFLDRTNIRKGAATIKEGIRRLESGDNLIVFPEGTRSPVEEMLPFKKGSMKLASKSGVKVVPFAIKGTNQMFEENNYRFRPWPVQLVFGEPIDLMSLEKGIDHTDYVKNAIEDLRKTLK